MNFTDYKYDKKWLADELAQKKVNLKANTGLSDLEGFALNNIKKRLNADARRYRDYGPYWWAVKSALNAYGYALGEQSDPLVLEEYQGESLGETLIAAEHFRDEYLASQMKYTNQFVLDSNSVEWYELFDQDMEMAN
jgi:hypothetical protein